MMSWISNCVAMCLALALTAAASAQRGAPSPVPTPLADASTIHVYANLLQIPVLILGPHRESLPPIPARNFLVHLGTYPAFKPRMVRLQGDDPITLAVLVDGSSRNLLLPGLVESLPAMVREQLHPRDRILMYAMDGCKLRRFGTLRPPDAEFLQGALDTAMSYPPYDAYKHGAERCAAPMGLWDALSYAADSLQGEPGRRVVLALSNGLDTGSRNTPETLRQIATHAGVAIFTVGEQDKLVRGQGLSTGVFTAAYGPSPLALISDGSGGTVFESNRKDLTSTLNHVVQLLRGRYIVEFSRPEGMSAGTHLMVISCGLPRAFIRSAGTSMPVADPIAADPTVQHGASTGAIDPPESPD